MLCLLTRFLCTFFLFGAFVVPVTSYAEQVVFAINKNKLIDYLSNSAITIWGIELPAGKTDFDFLAKYYSLSDFNNLQITCHSLSGGGGSRCLTTEDNDLAEMLLKKGLVIVNKTTRTLMIADDKDERLSLRKAYLIAEAKAAADKEGFWNDLTIDLAYLDKRVSHLDDEQKNVMREQRALMLAMTSEQDGLKYAYSTIANLRGLNLRNIQELDELRNNIEDSKNLVSNLGIASAATGGGMTGLGALITWWITGQYRGRKGKAALQAQASKLKQFAESELKTIASDDDSAKKAVEQLMVYHVILSTWILGLEELSQTTLEKHAGVLAQLAELKDKLGRLVDEETQNIGEEWGKVYKDNSKNFLDKIDGLIASM